MLNQRNYRYEVSRRFFVHGNTYTHFWMAKKESTQGTKVRCAFLLKPFGLLCAVDANGVYCLTPTGIGVLFIGVLSGGLRLAFGSS